MTTVSGDLTFTSTNGNGPELLGKLAAFVEDLTLSGIGMGVEVRLRPQGVGDPGLAAPLLSLVNTQGERVMAGTRIGEPAADSGEERAAVGAPPFVDPTPAAPARDPDEPQNEWNLRPHEKRKAAWVGRRMTWDWRLLRDAELRPTIVALDLERTTWREVKKPVRHQILEFFAAHLVQEAGSTRVPYKLWDERRPSWMPVATAAPVAYRMPWKALIENGALLLTPTGTAAGE